MQMMENSLPARAKLKASPKEKRCLSCGTTERLGRRRYCSVDCRQKLWYALDIRTGLLKALNVRYATFYFTEKIIVMDILPYNTREIFSFIYPRSHNSKPVEDYCRMSNLLGNEWWAEKKRTRKHYLASRRLFDRAMKNGTPAGAVLPLETKVPAIKSAWLTQLKLARPELNSPHLENKIRAAFRAQAKKHHPDLGGDTAIFRKIHEAYQKLIHWAENPSFIRRRGFPDKWLYEGYTNRWVQPKPNLKIG